jgi:hypothetical protein
MQLPIHCELLNYVANIYNTYIAVETVYVLFILTVLLVFFLHYVTEQNFQELQKCFMEKHWHEFEDKEENKLCYMDIFKEYVRILSV